MAKDAMAEAAALLSKELTMADAPEDIKNFTPSRRGDVDAFVGSLQDDPTYEKPAVSKHEEVVIKNDFSSEVREFPNYEDIKSKMKQGEKMYSLKNTADITLTTDWNLETLPVDMHGEFKKYLEAKYIQHGLQMLVGRAILVAIIVEGRTINFLENYLKQKQFPTLLPVVAGPEIDFRSQLVIPSGESVIVTERQMKALEAFHKVRDPHPQSDGKTTYSDWLGFLVVKELKPEDLKDIKRSFVTSTDVIRGKLEAISERVEREIKALGSKEKEYAEE